MPIENPGEPQPYTPGDQVRIYVERDGSLVPEDDWEYRSHRKEDDRVITAKQPPEGGATRFEETPKPEFDSWQHERMAEAAGRIVAADTLATSNAVETVISNEELAEKALRPSWGEFDENGDYKLTADPNELSNEIDIPSGVIRAAAEKGFPPEYLLAARSNPFSARRLKEAGVDWGAAPGGAEAGYAQWPENPPKLAKGVNLEDLSPDERREFLEKLNDYLASGGGRDPVFDLVAQGTRKKVQIQDYADRIASDPGSLKDELKRPGELPLKLHYAFGRKLGRLLIAAEMNKRERKERRDKKLGASSEEGLLKLGLPRIRRHLAHIKRHDEELRVLRNKLSPWNSHEYLGEEKASARRDLAELIYRAKRRQEALSGEVTHEGTVRKIHHKEVYVHKGFKEDLGDFHDSKGAKPKVSAQPGKTQSASPKPPARAESPPDLADNLRDINFRI